MALSSLHIMRLALIVAAIWGLVILSPASVEAQSHPELVASVESNQVVVDFTLNADSFEPFDAYLEGQGRLQVEWLLTLHELSKLWRDRAVHLATVTTTVERTGDDRFDVIRRINGQDVLRVQNVSRNAAYDAVGAFRGPVSDARSLNLYKDYEATIEARVSGGGLAPQTSKVLARAPLVTLP